MKKRVLVTGGKGLVGKAIEEISDLYREYDFYFVDHKNHDLCSEKDVSDLFKKVAPNYVIHTAAKTGGVKKDSVTPAERYYHNVLMNSYVIHYSHLYGVEKLLAFSSVACYDPSLKTLTEDGLHYGQPHENFKFYGHTKRMMDLQIESYNKQYGRSYSSLICGNIFGKHDGFDLKHGHVVPSLIHRCHLAKRNNVPFEIWGNGTPKREFVFSKDLAKICMELLKLDQSPPQRIIVAGNQQISISELVKVISGMFNKEEISWGTSGPSSNQNRITEKKVLNSLIPNLKYTSFSESIGETIEWFIDNYPNVRF